MLVTQITGVTTANVASVDSIESANVADESIKEEVQIDPQTVEEIVKEYFKETPILSKVAFCESGYRQFDANGQVLRGVLNPKDVGVMQINEYYHLKASQDLGLDIHTLEGNMAYAKYLYDKQGTAPWIYSSKCWAKGQSIALK